MSEWKLFAQGLNWDPSITSAKKRDENLSLVTRITHKAEKRQKLLDCFIECLELDVWHFLNKPDVIWERVGCLPFRVGVVQSVNAF